MLSVIVWRRALRAVGVSQQSVMKHQDPSTLPDPDDEPQAPDSSKVPDKSDSAADEARRRHQQQLDEFLARQRAALGDP